MKTPIDAPDGVSSAGGYKKKHASLTVAFVISGKTTDSFCYSSSPFFSSFVSPSSSRRIIPLSSHCLRGESSRERRSIINDMRHTGSRNIKYSRAFMTAPVGKRGRRGPRSLGPRTQGGRKRRGRKGESGSGCPPPPSPPSTNL